MARLNVQAIPAFDDNYLWLVHDDAHAAVIDPGEAAPVLAALAARHLSLVAILLTHNHADHVGGVSELLQHFKVPVYGPLHDHIHRITMPLKEGDTVNIADLALDLTVIDVPGHTRGHIAYFVPEKDWLFCGDTLFGGGCGRLFEGTPQQMLESLEKLVALPDDTQIFCAHEYTLSNLKFAREMEPHNAALLARIEAEHQKRAQGIPTVPSTLALEKATNPFLRYREPAIIERLRSTGRLQQDDPVATFAALREWKNIYR